MRTALVLGGAVALVAVGQAAARMAKMPVQWSNCSHVNRSYPHGVGRIGAHDSTSGDPVTNFKRSTKLFTLATSYNRGLDRDHDGIACEQA